MVLGWEGEIPARDRVFGTVTDEIILNTVCDIALVCRSPDNKDIDRIMIPVASIKYAVLSFKIAEAILKQNDTPIVLFHATNQTDVVLLEQKYREDLEKQKNDVDPARYEIVIKRTDNFAEAILAEIQPNDLVIMGAPEEGLVRRAFFGDLPLYVARKTDVPIILTKRYTGHVKSWFQKFFGSRKTMLD